LAKTQGTDTASVEKEFFRSVRPSSLLKRFATPEEVAALVAVLTARAQAAAAAGEEPRVSRWAERSRMMRTPVSDRLLPRGPGAWRASALPR
jgi:hypothetical protein